MTGRTTTPNVLSALRSSRLMRSLIIFSVVLALDGARVIPAANAASPSTPVRISGYVLCSNAGVSVDSQPVALKITAAGSPVPVQTITFPKQLTPTSLTVGPTYFVDVAVIFPANRKSLTVNNTLSCTGSTGNVSKTGSFSINRDRTSIAKNFCLNGGATTPCNPKLAQALGSCVVGFVTGDVGSVILGAVASKPSLDESLLGAFSSFLERVNSGKYSGWSAAFGCFPIGIDIESSQAPAASAAATPATAAPGVSASVKTATPASVLQEASTAASNAVSVATLPTLTDWDRSRTKPGTGPETFTSNSVDYSNSYQMCVGGAGVCWDDKVRDFWLGKGYTQFQMTVLPDPQTSKAASAKVMVIADGRVVAEGIAGSAPITMRADVSGASTLRLSMEQTGSGLYGGWFATPQLTAAANTRLTSAPTEPAVLPVAGLERDRSAPDLANPNIGGLSEVEISRRRFSTAVSGCVNSPGICGGVKNFDFVVPAGFQNVRGTMALGDDSAPNASAGVTLALDGRVVFQAIIKRGDFLDVDVPLGSVRTLRFTVTPTGSGLASASFGGARLTRGFGS